MLGINSHDEYNEKLYHSNIPSIKDFWRMNFEICNENIPFANFS